MVAVAAHQRQHRLERRLTDAAAELVAAQIHVLEVENNGQEGLAEERWRAHSEVHAQLAEALKEYKAAANEWRSLVSDFKSDYLSLPEWKAEHRSLIARVETLERTALQVAEYQASHTSLVNRVSSLETNKTEMSAEASTVRSLFNTMRNLLLFIIALITVAVVLITFFKG